MEFHRGRLIDHIRLPVKDIAKSRHFYEAILAKLSIPISKEGDGWFLADDIMIYTVKRKPPAAHVALQARDQETVRQCYEIGLARGGKPEALPGLRDFHPYYFAATLLDPDGHQVEFVNHGPISRSAASVVVKPSAMALLRKLF